MDRYIFLSRISIFSLILFFIIACNKSGNPSDTNEKLDEQSIPEAGESRIDSKGVTQVYVPAGTFLMGTNDEEKDKVKASNPPAWVVNELTSEQPKHEVQLTSGYWIDKYEVTNEAFRFSLVTAVTINCNIGQAMVKNG